VPPGTPDTVMAQTGTEKKKTLLTTETGMLHNLTEIINLNIFQFIFRPALVEIYPRETFILEIVKIKNTRCR
jgi:hypothetical protein